MEPICLSLSSDAKSISWSERFAGRPMMVPRVLEGFVVSRSFWNPCINPDFGGLQIRSPADHRDCRQTGSLAYSKRVKEVRNGSNCGRMIRVLDGVKGHVHPCCCSGPKEVCESTATQRSSCRCQPTALACTKEQSAYGSSAIATSAEICVASRPLFHNPGQNHQPSRIRSSPRRIGPPRIAASSKKHISTLLKADIIPVLVDTILRRYRAPGKRIVVLCPLTVCALSYMPQPPAYFSCRVKELACVREFVQSVQPHTANHKNKNRTRLSCHERCSQWVIQRSPTSPRRRSSSCYAYTRALDRCQTSGDRYPMHGKTMHHLRRQESQVR